MGGWDGWPREAVSIVGARCAKTNPRDTIPRGTVRTLIKFEIPSAPCVFSSGIPGDARATDFRCRVSKRSRNSKVKISFKYIIVMNIKYISKNTIGRDFLSFFFPFSLNHRG